MVVNIYCPPTPYQIKTKADYHIGIEHAALYALNQNIALDLVISDFDSTTLKDQTILKEKGVPLDIHPSIKDDTDAALAIKKALKLDPKTIYLYTAAGTRIDHLYANLLLLQKGPIVLINDHVKAYVLNPGSHVIKASLKYISFFAVDAVKGLNLNGFRYPLEAYDLNKSDPIGVSNEGSGTLSFSEGHLLVIESKD